MNKKVIAWLAVLLGVLGLLGITYIMYTMGMSMLSDEITTLVFIMVFSTLSLYNMSPFGRFRSPR